MNAGQSSGDTKLIATPDEKSKMSRIMENKVILNSTVTTVW